MPYYYLPSLEYNSFKINKIDIEMKLNDFKIQLHKLYKINNRTRKNIK